MHELRAIVPYRAAMLCHVDPLTGRGRPIMREDYSDPLVTHLLGAEFRGELVEPFGFNRSGWPIRERDLPVDPLSVRSIADHLRPDGYVEGLLSALVASDGRYLGFLIVSVEDRRHPTNAACAAVGRVAPLLANLVDPLQSARWLTSTLLDEETAVGLLPDGTVVPLRGAVPAELLDPDSGLRRAAGALLARRGLTGAFVVPSGEGGWLGCRVFRCRDDVEVIAVRGLDALYGLTRRELEVLRYLTEGRSNAEIAQELWITTRTTRAHVGRILDKLGVSSRSGAVAKALAEGLMLAA
jgi:DNA-binding CsgD family transcriptional regulator